MSRERIMIAIPTLSGKLHVPLVHFCLAAQASAHEPGSKFDFEIALIPELWPHYYARNYAVGVFLKSGCDRMWFIDDDMIPTRASFAMLQHDADIVSGFYMVLKKSPDGLAYDPQSLLFREPKDKSVTGFVHDYPKNANDMVHEVAGAGAGCLLIKRHVLADRRMWYPTQYVNLKGETVDYMDEATDDNDKWAPPVFLHHWKPGGDQLRAEDLDFCDRARKLGYKIVGDFNAVFGHLKTADVQLIAQTISRATQAGITLAGQKEKGANESAA